LQSVLQEDPNAKSLKTSELTPLVKHLSPDLTSEQRQTLVDDIAYDCTLAQDFCHQLQSFEAHAMEDTPNQHVVQPANFETLKRFYQRLQDHCRDLYRDGLDQDRLTRITERLEPLINRRMACFQIQNSLDKLTDEIERQRPYLNQYPGIKQVLKELVYTIATAGIYAGYKLGVVVSNRYHYGHYTFFAAQARSLNTLDELRQDLKNT
jgi:hypothetical protein